MFFKYIPPLFQTSLKTYTHNLRNWPLRSRPNLSKNQLASLVYVAALQRSNPAQSSPIQVTHRHPNARQADIKTYEIDVLFANDDDAADVCWRFQIEEGENQLDRLLAYAHALGKYGSGDEDYDEYVQAFQSEITGLVVKMWGEQGKVQIEEERDVDSCSETPNNATTDDKMKDKK